MGDERLPARADAGAAAERLARRPHRREGAVPVVLLRVHAHVGAVRARVVRAVIDRVPRAARRQRRAARADGADDDRARRRPADGPRNRLRGGARAARADPRPRGRRRDPAVRVVALAVSREPARRRAGARAGRAVPAGRPGRRATAQTRLDRPRLAVARPRAVPVWRRADRHGARHRRDRMLCAAARRVRALRATQGRKRTDRSRAVSLPRIRRGGRHAVPVERRDVRGPDADSRVPDPGVRALAGRDGLAARAARARHARHLSVDGRVDEPVRRTPAGRRRCVARLRRDAAVRVPRADRLRSVRARAGTVSARHGPERDRCAVDLRRVCVGRAPQPADGDDVAQYRAAPRRPDVHDDMHAVPRMAATGRIVGGRRYASRRIRVGVRPALRAACGELRHDAAAAVVVGRYGRAIGRRRALRFALSAGGALPNFAINLHLPRGQRTPAATELARHLRNGFARFRTAA
ncbi:putative Major Facilitator Superfamily protein [Burkholderia sp. IT-111MI5]